MCVCVSNQTANERRPLKLRELAKTNFYSEFVAATGKKVPSRKKNLQFLFCNFFILCKFMQVVETGGQHKVWCLWLRRLLTSASVIAGKKTMIPFLKNRDV